MGNITDERVKTVTSLEKINEIGEETRILVADNDTIKTINATYVRHSSDDVVLPSRALNKDCNGNIWIEDTIKNRALLKDILIVQNEADYTDKAVSQNSLIFSDENIFFITPGGKGAKVDLKTYAVTYFDGNFKKVISDENYVYFIGADLSSSKCFDVNTLEEITLASIDNITFTGTFKNNINGRYGNGNFIKDSIFVVENIEYINYCYRVYINAISKEWGVELVGTVDGSFDLITLEDDVLKGWNHNNLPYRSFTDDDYILDNSNVRYSGLFAKGRYRVLVSAKYVYTIDLLNESNVHRLIYDEINHKGQNRIRSVQRINDCELVIVDGLQGVYGAQSGYFKYFLNNATGEITCQYFNTGSTIGGSSVTSENVFVDSNNNEIYFLHDEETYVTYQNIYIYKPEYKSIIKIKTKEGINSIISESDVVSICENYVKQEIMIPKWTFYAIKNDGKQGVFELSIPEESENKNSGKIKMEIINKSNNPLVYLNSSKVVSISGTVLGDLQVGIYTTTNASYFGIANYSNADVKVKIPLNSFILDSSIYCSVDYSSSNFKVLKVFPQNVLSETTFDKKLHILNPMKEDVFVNLTGKIAITSYQSLTLDEQYDAIRYTYNGETYIINNDSSANKQVYMVDADKNIVVGGLNLTGKTLSISSSSQRKGYQFDSGKCYYWGLKKHYSEYSLNRIMLPPFPDLTNKESGSYNLKLMKDSGGSGSFWWKAVKE